MKKIAALLVSALICAYSFAVDKPWLSISVETPKKFFSDVSDIMRKVYHAEKSGKHEDFPENHVPESE